MGAWEIIEPLNIAEITFSGLALRELEENSDFSYKNINNYRQNMEDHMKIQIEKDINQKYTPDFNLSLIDFFSDKLARSTLVIHQIITYLIFIVILFSTTLMLTKMVHYMMP